MTGNYDVIIVGGGPAGLFTALEITGRSGLSVLLLEKGKDIDRRVCPVRDTGGGCISCDPCNLVCGLGGAGAFSDGKLVLSSKVGGQLLAELDEGQGQELIKYVDDVYLKFGAPEKLFGNEDGIKGIQRRASLAELRLIPTSIRHLGTENCQAVLSAMRDSLKPRVDFALDTMVSEVLTEKGRVKGVRTDDGTEYGCRYLVLAPGREGADWFSREATRLKLSVENNPVDVGVRVEVPAAVLAELTAALYEVKLEFLSKSFDDRIRTFCMCPGGEVIAESTGGSDPVITVNGHSYAQRKSDNTNFAILVSTSFTKPFREPIAYGKYIARLANILSGGVLVQRLGDLMQGHRSTAERINHGLLKPSLASATPGDLSFALPYRHLAGIVEMLQAMDRLVPGVASRHTLLYGVEVKFYSYKPQLSHELETEIGNLFAVGDGAGISRGLVQASASGVIAGRGILGRSGK